MKDKITKRNMTKFDYSARKLGIIGAVIFVLSLAVILPIANSVSSHNGSISVEIQQLHEEMKDDNNNIVLEKK